MRTPSDWVVDIIHSWPLFVRLIYLIRRNVRTISTHAHRLPKNWSPDFILLYNFNRKKIEKIKLCTSYWLFLNVFALFGNIKRTRYLTRWRFCRLHFYRQAKLENFVCRRLLHVNILLFYRFSINFSCNWNYSSYHETTFQMKITSSNFCE